MASPAVTDPRLTSDKWSTWMFRLYHSRKGPLLGTVEHEKLEEKAREVLKDHHDAYMYVFGSAGTNSTYRNNRKAFDKWSIVPRMLVNATNRDVKTKIFGVEYSAPLFLAPIGVHGIVHADGELAGARAAAKLNVPFIMSTASTRSIEAVAEANGPNGQRWYQLYWPKSHEVTVSILSRAKKAGFTALVVTLDTPSIGWRPHDLETAYLPFTHGVGSQVGSSDPVFMKRLGLEPDVNDKPDFPYNPAEKDKAYLAGDEKVRRDTYAGLEFLKETNSGVYRTWDDLKLLREAWDGPIVLKGIQHVLDAEKAIDYVEGIIVSNHGGRQVDGAIGSLSALDTICQSPKVRAAQESGKLTVLFDSGIRTGSDIIKALALGAQAVFLGRPWMYGLTIAGQEGIEEVVRTTLADFEVTLGLSGNTSIVDIWGKRDTLLVKTDA